VSGEHYFSARPQAQARPTEVEFEVAGRGYRLQAMAGVFSAGRLDPGTAVLLRKADLPAPWATGTLLDLGCGYGPIAAVLARRAPQATIYAVDVNQRALELVRRNAGQRVIPATPDEVPEDVRFVEIWSNPPIRIGKPALHAMLRRWLSRLVPGGRAWLVVARNLGADSLQQWLTAEGWPTVRHASQKGFRVLRVSAAEEHLDRPAGAAPEPAAAAANSRDGTPASAEND
jgi:16S rRNA (guanine1207-N2)-methyltransferase